jgi:glycosyltransferase involved in cell wall biosynthesis
VPPLFTVFTPTYNRAHTLPAVFQALQAQTDADFEWLVVDDGSTDDTAELVGSWTGTATFPVRLLRQPNGGKHRAFNRGVAEAVGELFVTLDSDDTCTPRALERFRALWEAIPASDRDGFSGVTVLCDGPDGRVLGRPFARDVVDARPVDLVARGEYVGDKWGFHRTDVLRQFPFPEYPASRSCPRAWYGTASDVGTRCGLSTRYSSARSIWPTA